MIQKEIQIDSKPVFSGKILGVRVDTVRLPDGNTATREIVEHGGAVVMVPMPDAESVILVRQYRHPTGQIMLELPAGALGKGEDPDHSAAREMAEETGFVPRQLEKLLEFYVAPGYCQEKLHLYLATDLVPQKAQGDPDEFVETEVISLAAALNKIASGEICDAKTIIGLLVAARRFQSDL
jgi:ADP-ribose pyrophosphatase